MSTNGHHPTYDAIIVGGGHNGLTAAAYLAQGGLRVCVLERRDILGGACVTEEVWPGHRVSRASYVVSLLHPKVVADLRLNDFGYEVHPLDPAYATLPPDGPPLFFFNDEAATVESIRPHSRRDAEAYPAFQALLERMGDFLRPMLLRPPPAVGSRHPGDLLSLLREAGRAAGLSKRDIFDFYRVMTMAVGDLLDDWFECDAFKGAMASTGVVGVWAGPRTPGTAYNLLHHELGEIDGVPGLWGHVKGGMGAISMAIARSAEAAGAVIRTGAAVTSIDVAGGHTVGVTLGTGEELRAPVVVSGAHPKTTVLDMVGAEHFPAEVVEDMRRYKTRGGSVKVNWVLSEPPRYEGVAADDQERLIRSGVAFCPSIDYLERAWQDACRGVPSAAPYLEVETPSTIDSTLTDDGTTIVRCSGSTGRGRSPGGRRARATRTPTAAWRSSPSGRRTCATRWCTARCWRRRTSSASSAWSAARSSRASRGSTRWRSCGRRPRSRSTRRRSTGCTCAAPARIRAAA
jgi:phytoene dehydrogenase-like protein